MKKYGKIFVILLLLAAVITGAAFAYRKLKNQVQSPALVEEQEEQGPEEQEPDELQSGEEPSEEENEDKREDKEGDKKDGSERQEAIDVSFYDSEGNAVQLSDFYGKPVVMNFWATWCGYCKQEMPDFQEAYEEYGDRVEFLFINSTDGARETREKASAYLEEQGYTVPAYYDEDMEAVYAYSINSLPTTILLDKEGKVAAYAPGLVEKEMLTAGLDTLLNE